MCYILVVICQYPTITGFPCARIMMCEVLNIEKLFLSKFLDLSYWRLMTCKEKAMKLYNEKYKQDATTESIAPQKCWEILDEYVAYSHFIVSFKENPQNVLLSYITKQRFEYQINIRYVCDNICISGSISQKFILWVCFNVADNAKYSFCGTSSSGNIICGDPKVLERQNLPKNIFLGKNIE